VRPPTTQSPRRPIGAGGVRGGSRSGSLSVVTTHALFARKVQHKVSNGVAAFAARGSSLIGKNRGNFRVISVMQIDDQRLREDARGMPTLGQSCVPPGTAAQTRMVAWPEFGWIPTDLFELSMGYFATKLLSSRLWMAGPPCENTSDVPAA
jgi:hypothetical protein